MSHKPWQQQLIPSSVPELGMEKMYQTVPLEKMEVSQSFRSWQRLELKGGVIESGERLLIVGLYKLYSPPLGAPSEAPIAKR